MTYQAEASIRVMLSSRDYQELEAAFAVHGHQDGINSTLVASRYNPDTSCLPNEAVATFNVNRQRYTSFIGPASCQNRSLLNDELR